MREDIKERIELIKQGKAPKGYKKTPIGIIPTDWKVMRFDECAVILGGLIDPKKKPYRGMKHIGSDNIEKETGIIIDIQTAEEQGLISGKYVFDSDSIIYSKIRPKLNKACTPDFCGICSADCYVIHVKNNVKKNYLHNYILSEIFLKQAVACSMRTKMPKVNQNELSAIKVIIPQIDKQEKIITILKAYDNKISLMKFQICQKSKLKKWLMQNLLTGKKRLTGYKKLWSKKYISDIAVLGSKERVVNLKKYKRITIKLNFGGIEISKEDRELADTRPFYIRRIGELIIGKQNYFNGSIALVTKEFDNTICSNAIMSFRICEDRVDPFFLLKYLSQPDYIHRKSYLANGTGQKELSEKEFLKFEVMLPEIQEQKAIAKVLKTADREIELLEKKLELIKQEKKAMMQLLLTGIVRVNKS